MVIFRCPEGERHLDSTPLCIIIIIILVIFYNQSQNSFARNLNRRLYVNPTMDSGDDPREARMRQALAEIFPGQRVEFVYEDEDQATATGSGIHTPPRRVDYPRPRMLFDLTYPTLSSTYRRRPHRSPPCLTHLILSTRQVIPVRLRFADLFWTSGWTNPYLRKYRFWTPLTSPGRPGPSRPPRIVTTPTLTTTQVSIPQRWTRSPVRRRGRGPRRRGRDDGIAPRRKRWGNLLLRTSGTCPTPRLIKF